MALDTKTAMGLSHAQLRDPKAYAASRPNGYPRHRRRHTPTHGAGA